MTLEKEIPNFYEDYQYWKNRAIKLENQLKLTQSKIIEIIDKRIEELNKQLEEDKENLNYSNITEKQAIDTLIIILESLKKEVKHD
jgi:hypothetical protein